MTALAARADLTHRLTRPLHPRTLAVFGGSAAVEVVRQARKIGFDGRIWPVHPNRTEIEGLRSYRSVADLPEAPDAAFIGVNRHASIDIVTTLAERGTGGAVVLASGYAEAGAEGTALQHELCAAAGAMPFFGPNCYGFINYLDRALLWPDQHGGLPVARGVAIITQSGNIGLNLTMQKRALPIGYLITLGNQASISHAECIEAVLDDPRITAIGLHLEGLEDPHGLARAVARARAKRVPVVALKTGRSVEAARIVQSHTAAMTSSDSVVDAFFKRIGIARVDNIPALLETLKLLHYVGPLDGRSISSLSCSGGEAALIADAAAAAGLLLAPLAPKDRAAIASTVPDLVSISNPLDYHTFGWRNRSALTATFSAIMRAGADLNLLILDFPRQDRCDPADWEVAAAAMAEAAAIEQRPAAILATLPDAFSEDRAVGLAEQGLVPLLGIAEALQAIAAAADAGLLVDGSLAPNPQLIGSASILSEFDAKQLLASYGVPIPSGALATSAATAVLVAEQLGFPVVIKAAGPAIAHKTELNALRLNLQTRDAVHAAAATLLPVTGMLLVEQMVVGSIAELIVGIARDDNLGTYLTLGSGGILAELVGDTTTVMLPATSKEIRHALNELRIARLLRGFRGAPPADVEAAIGAVLGIQQLALANLDRLQEMDVNPLMVCEAGKGAVAVDVLLRLAPAREVEHA